MIMELYLPAKPPFNLHTVAHSHGWLRLAPFREVEDGLAYIAHLASGKILEIDIRSAEQGALVRVDDDLTPDEKQQIVDWVGWMLGLDQDFSEFYTLASQEPKLAHVEGRAQGRVLRSPSLFEDVVKTILTTNTLWAATIRMNLNLANLYGSALPDDATRHAFPTSAQLAVLDEAALRAGGRLGYRAPYVLELARRVHSGDLDLETLKNSDLSTPDLRKRLRAIKGVGDYAAANLLMILGRFDYIPVDSWALKMVSHEWYSDQPVGRAEVEAAFERFGRFKGLAYWFWDWSWNN